MNAHQTDVPSEEYQLLAQIKEHLNCALRLMDELRPASAFAARCQELIDGLADEAPINE